MEIAIGEVRGQKSIQGLYSNIFSFSFIFYSFLVLTYEQEIKVRLKRNLGIGSRKWEGTIRLSILLWKSRKFLVLTSNFFVLSFFLSFSLSILQHPLTKSLYFLFSSTYFLHVSSYFLLSTHFLILFSLFLLPSSH